MQQAAEYSERCAETGNAEDCALAEQWLNTAEVASDALARAIEAEAANAAGKVGAFAKLLKWAVLGGVALVGFQYLPKAKSRRSGGYTA
jgi:hypothetical protein